MRTSLRVIFALCAALMLTALHLQLTVHHIWHHNVFTFDHDCGHHHHDSSDESPDESEECLVCDFECSLFLPAPAFSFSSQPNGWMVVEDHLIDLVQQDEQNRLPELRGPPMS